MHALLTLILDTVLRFMKAVTNWIYKRLSGQEILVLDSGKRVTIGPKIAEGGFSVVFEAIDASSGIVTNDNDASGSNSTVKSIKTSPHGTNRIKYALKRIRCPEPEMLESCQREATVHRSVNHPNLMPLLGMTIINDNKSGGDVCYMLFPYAPHSLRVEMNRRIPSLLLGKVVQQDCPWSNEVTVLQLFYQICCGVNELHDHGYSHRDIKLENIALVETADTTRQTPILMDFGSSGPVTEPISTRRHVLTIIDTASCNTTMSYRPPELFEGGVRYDPNCGSVLDFRSVDVWSLGCTFFAMLYGVPPAECEFGRSDGRISVAECNHLSVLKGIPSPPKHTSTSTWYRHDFHDMLLEPMLRQDHSKRIQLPILIQEVERAIRNRGSSIQKHSYNSRISGITTSDGGDYV